MVIQNKYRFFRFRYFFLILLTLSILSCDPLLNYKFFIKNDTNYTFYAKTKFDEYSTKDTTITIFPDSISCVYIYDEIGTPIDLSIERFKEVVPNIEIHRREILKYTILPRDKKYWAYSEDSRKVFFWGKVGDSYYTFTISDTIQ